MDQKNKQFALGFDELFMYLESTTDRLSQGEYFSSPTTTLRSAQFYKPMEEIRAYKEPLIKIIEEYAVKDIEEQLSVMEKEGLGLHSRRATFHLEVRANVFGFQLIVAVHAQADCTLHKD